MTAPSPRELNVDLLIDIKNTLDEILREYRDAYEYGHWASTSGNESGRTGHSDPTVSVMLTKGALRGECATVARELRKVRKDIDGISARLKDHVNHWDDREARTKRRDIEDVRIVPARSPERRATQENRDRAMNADLGRQAAERLADRVRSGYDRLANKVAEA